MGSTYGDDYEDDGYWVSPTSDDDYDDGGYYGEDYGNDSDYDDNDDVGNFIGSTYCDGYEHLIINNLSNAFDRIELFDQVGSDGYCDGDYWTDDFFDDRGLSLSECEYSEFDANFCDFDFL